MLYVRHALARVRLYNLKEPTSRVGAVRRCKRNAGDLLNRCFTPKKSRLCMVDGSGKVFRNWVDCLETMSNQYGRGWPLCFDLENLILSL